MRHALWIVQGLLAVAFLFSGVSKLTAPADVLATLYPFPEGFMRFIGVCEALGALGLVLPGLLRLRTGLTPMAAAGLVIIMTGATLSTLAIGGSVLALMPLLLGILAAFVAYGR